MSLATEAMIEAPANGARKPYALVAQFTHTPAFFEAAAKVRDAGYKKWDCFTPFPVHGLDDQMGVKRSKVPLFTFCGGLFGFCLGTFITWYMNMYDYPLIVGGKPFWSPLFPFPVMYEMTILNAAFGTLLGMFVMNMLPRHNHPLFDWDKFDRSGDDLLYIAIERADPQFDLEQTKAFLASLGAEEVHLVEAEV